MESNPDTYETKWMQVRGAIKRQWGELIDDERSKRDGRYKQLVSLLQQKYGRRRGAEREKGGGLSRWSRYGEEPDESWSGSSQVRIARMKPGIARYRWLLVATTFILTLAVGIGLWIKLSHE